jgi:hypothetical protein
MVLTYAGTVFAFVLSFLFSFRFVNSPTPLEGVATRLLRETIRWIVLLAFPLMFYSQVDSRQTWIRLVNLQIVVAGVISLVSFVWLALTYLDIVPLLLGALFLEPGGVTLRLTGTLAEPSQFATYLTITFFLGFGSAIEQFHERRYSNLLWLSVIAIAVIFTYSTSAFVIFLGIISVGGLFVLDALTEEHNAVYEYLVWATTIAAGGIVLLALVALTFNFILTNIFGSVPNIPGPRLFFTVTIGKLMNITELASTRWATFLTGLEMWSENPILGVGLGNHFYLFTDYSSRSLSSGRGPASVFVGVLATTGLVGLTMFVLYLAEIHRTVRTAFVTAISRDDWHLFGVYLAFFGVIVGYGINPSFRLAFNVVFLGLILGSAKY